VCLISGFWVLWLFICQHSRVQLTSQSHLLILRLMKIRPRWCDDIFVQEKKLVYKVSMKSKSTLFTYMCIPSSWMGEVLCLCALVTPFYVLIQYRLHAWCVKQNAHYYFSCAAELWICFLMMHIDNGETLWCNHTIFAPRYDIYLCFSVIVRSPVSKDTLETCECKRCSLLLGQPLLEPVDPRLPPVAPMPSEETDPTNMWLQLLWHRLPHPPSQWLILLPSGDKAFCPWQGAAKLHLSVLFIYRSINVHSYSMCSSIVLSFTAWRMHLWSGDCQKQKSCVLSAEEMHNM